MKNHIGNSVFAIAIALALFAHPAKALTCGQGITASVTLTQDYVCNGFNFLQVMADNVTIDLNGHTVTCVSSNGYLGSCQGYVNNPVGILILNHVNVTVLGPGVISGFDEGVWAGNTHGVSIIGVTITGPPAPLSTDLGPAVNKRPASLGITIFQAGCTLAPGWSSVLEFNEISNHTTGISLALAECVLAYGNYTHDNTSGTMASYGITVENSSFNLISNNIVTRNGTNQTASAGAPHDAGILLASENAMPISLSPTQANTIYFNFVGGNCGDGISLGDGQSFGGNNVANNNIVQNTSLSNSTSNLGGQCAAAGAGAFFDLSDRGAGSGNIWNTNNTCKTESTGIPAGICH